MLDSFSQMKLLNSFFFFAAETYALTNLQKDTFFGVWLFHVYSSKRVFFVKYNFPTFLPMQI